MSWRRGMPRVAVGCGWVVAGMHVGLGLCRIGECSHTQRHRVWAPHACVCACARVVVGAIARPVGPPAAAHVRARPHTQPCERRLNCALAAHTQWRWTHPERASTSHPPHARWHTTHAHTAGGMHVLSCIHTAPRPPAHIRLICRRVPRGMCDAALPWVLRPGGKQGVYIVCCARHQLA